MMAAKNRGRRIREVVALALIGCAFLIAIPSVPSIPDVSPSFFPSGFVAFLVFLVGVAVGWREGDSYVIAGLKCLLFLGYSVLLLMRLSIR
jgi:hypothetical protein